MTEIINKNTNKQQATRPLIERLEGFSRVKVANRLTCRAVLVQTRVIAKWALKLKENMVGNIFFENSPLKIILILITNK